ncbi:MAG TPA: endolytic transglycosylase MltG, partial [Vibrio sp.]|nr:endolytic transglycosylase MltG [Vibrio sp.]
KDNEFIQQTLNDVSEKEIAQKLGIENEKLEGLFLAETYHYTYGTTDLDLLKRAHRDLMNVVNDEWENRADKLPLKSPYEALILASIIEKETAVASERERVSSVFVNRLNKRMRLQTDPTVIYGMGDSYKGNIRKKDLRTPTPYNTYTMSGLPPTPIAMAGKASINAALNPEKSNYLYFVASGTGGHVFSKSLTEHNRAVRAYLKQLRKNK